MDGVLRCVRETTQQQRRRNQNERENSPARSWRSSSKLLLTNLVDVLDSTAEVYKNFRREASASSNNENLSAVEQLGYEKVCHAPTTALAGGLRAAYS